MYNVNIILACDVCYGIGKNNDILYHFKEDLERFKKITSGKTVIMGRKTWESLPFKLPNRKNIVISTHDELEGLVQPDIICDIDTALEIARNEEVWVIGGAQIYELFIFYTNRIELTRIVGDKESDINVKFLEDHLLNYNITNLQTSSDIDKKTDKEYKLNYIRYERKKN